MKALRRGERVVEVLKQKQQSPYKLWEEALLIFAVTNGYFDKFEKKEVKSKMAQMLAHTEFKGKDLIDLINRDKDLTDEISTLLKQHVEEALQ